MAPDSKVHTIIMPDTYRDSVFLMKLSSEAKTESGAEQISAMMGTPRNKELFESSGLSTPDVVAAGADDLVIAIKAPADILPKAEEAVKRLLAAVPAKRSVEGGASVPHDLAEALEADPDCNFAIISVAGDYARYEAALAVAASMDVMLYSDNISLENEIALKQLASRKGVLVMGPDCGTALIDGVPMAFANRVAKGPVGIVGASGTGLQEVICLLDRLGAGISQAFGAGGRDLKDDVGGLTAIAALHRLAHDEETKVIVLLGKPPGEATRKKLIEILPGLGKPVFVHYLGAEDHKPEEAAGLTTAANLTELALAVARHLNPAAPVETVLQDIPLPPAGKPGYLRGLFGGGTLCQEAAELAAPYLKGEKFANLKVKGFGSITAHEKSKGNCFWDFGDDVFTVGRPHPMMAPELKMERMVAELIDPEVAVVLLDMVIGFGAHQDQVGEFMRALNDAKRLAPEEVAKKRIVVSVCGTDADTPGRAAQVEALKKAGVVVPGSNAQAAVWAAKTAGGVN